MCDFWGEKGKESELGAQEMPGETDRKHEVQDGRAVMSHDRT